MLDFNRIQDKVNNDAAEVRVKVKLTNSIDEGLIYRGYLKPSDLHVYETTALVDTSSVRAVIPMEVAQKLGLRIRSEQVAKCTDDRQETSEEPLVGGDEILIGRIALETLGFVVDIENHRLIPNPKHPDGPVFRI